MGSINGFPCSYLFVLVCFFLVLHAKSASIDRTTYIVHMDKSLMPKAFTSYQNWYHSLIDSLSYTESAPLGGHLSSSLCLYSYDHALHGFSASLSLYMN
jgi:hypothetical protein